MSKLIDLISNKILLPQDYHNFSDKRNFIEIPNFMNVFSNIFILLPALYLLQTRTQKSYKSNLLIIHIILLSFWSSYYHINPSDDTLFMDIMMIATSFIIVLSIINTELNNTWVLLLYIYAIFSITYWKNTRDLRFYLIILIGVPLYIIIKYFKIKKFRNYIYLFIFANILMRLSEHNDNYIYQKMNQFISGHTLKHIFAGIGIFYVIKILQIEKKL